MANTSSLDRLGTLAANTAMHAAAEYIRSHKVTVADYASATEIIKRHTKAAVSEALEDARKAIEAGMGQVAEATFLASMQIAGIKAGKEIAAS